MSHLVESRALLVARVTAESQEAILRRRRIPYHQTSKECTKDDFKVVNKSK